MVKPQPWKAWVQGAAVPLLLLALWQGVASMGWVNPQVLPSPLAVARRWWEYLAPGQPFDPAQGGRLAWLVSGELLQDAVGSLYRVLAGFFIGAALGLPLGLLMGANERVFRLLNPLIQVLRPIRPSPTSRWPSCGSAWATRRRSS
jgi:NitT/TauT family transport system permease protein